MPPRKPLSQRNSNPGAVRGGARHFNPDGPKPPGGPTRVGPEPQRVDKTIPRVDPRQVAKDPEVDVQDDDGIAREYQTGSDYPAGDEESAVEEDIYGENDPFPDEDGEAAAPRHATEEFRNQQGRSPEVTRIGPVVSARDDDDDEGDDEQATRSGPPIHLEVISGPDQGRKKRFRGVRMVVGRTDGCDFKLEDNSVSRRHLELVLGDAGVMLRDLGSGNGTRVNDDKVNEKLLEDGDEISIGKTRFRFVDELAALQKKKEAEEAAAAEAAAQEEAAAAEAAAAEQASAAEGDAEAAAAEDAAGDEGEEAPSDEDGEAEGGEEEAPARKRKGRASANDQPTAAVMPRGRRGNLAGRRSLQALDPKQKRLLALASIGSALVVLLLMALIFKKAPPPPPDQKEPLAAAKMQEARNALREERFEEALGLIAAAEQLKPGADPTNLASAAKKELQAQQALAEVRRLIAAGSFDEARQTLKAAPLAIVINDSKAKVVEQELNQAEAEYGRTKAEEALAAQDPERAEAIIKQLPRAMAQALYPRLEAVKAEAAQRAIEEAKRSKAEALASAKAARQRRGQQIDEAFIDVSRKFNAQDFSRAALECDRVVANNPGDAEIRQRANNLKKWMPLFGRYWSEGQRKYRAGSLDASARPLTKAKELYDQIGFDGALGVIIDEQLAGAALAAGKAAAQRNDLSTAGNYYRQALRLNPGEIRAQQGLDRIAEQAEELYLKAYMIRDRDPKEAAGMFRTVMDAVPKNSPTWVKASTQLKNLGL